MEYMTLLVVFFKNIFHCMTFLFLYRKFYWKSEEESLVKITQILPHHTTTSGMYILSGAITTRL